VTAAGPKYWHREKSSTTRPGTRSVPSSSGAIRVIDAAFEFDVSSILKSTVTDSICNSRTTVPANNEVRDTAA